MVLQHLFLDMMVKERGATRSTIAAYEADLCNFYAFLKGQKVEEVTFQDVESYILTQSHLSPSTVTRRLVSLRQFYAFLLSQGKVTENPFSLLKSAYPKPQTSSFLSQHDVNRLLEGATMWEGPEGKRLAVLLHILYATGMAVNELVSLPFISPTVIASGAKQSRATTILWPWIASAPLVLRNDEKLEIKLQTHRNNVLVNKSLQEYLKVRSYFLMQDNESPWLFPSLSQKGYLTRQRFGQLLKELAVKVGLDSTHISLSIIRRNFNYFNKM